ncbi:GIY-YIG nuclease family protein [Candidatus Omnitrophota bacterium]
MKAKRTGASSSAEPWHLYIAKCKDGSLYTGITKDVERRVKMHNSGKAAYYTSMRRPVKLCYQEECVDRSSALIRECEIKTFPREKKLALVNSKRKKRKKGKR